MHERIGEESAEALAWAIPWLIPGYHASCEEEGEDSVLLVEYETDTGSVRTTLRTRGEVADFLRKALAQG